MLLDVAHLKEATLLDSGHSEAFSSSAPEN